jgi:nucleotide-binding universal stress UspA family protein
MDLVVVGTHGRTGLVRLVLGSVARNVLLHAHASVLVLHAPAASGDRATASAARGSAA